MACVKEKSKSGYFLRQPSTNRARISLRGTGTRILRQKANFSEKNERFEIRKAPLSVKTRHSCICGYIRAFVDTFVYSCDIRGRFYPENLRRYSKNLKICENLRNTRSIF